jgi:hypothetical protein
MRAAMAAAPVGDDQFGEEGAYRDDGQPGLGIANTRYARAVDRARELERFRQVELI